MPLIFKLTFCFILFYQAQPYFKKALNGANVGLNGQNRTLVCDTAVFNRAVATDSNQAMVPLNPFLTTFYSDLKYATPDNFTGKVLYDNPKLFVRLPVAKALQQVLDELKKQGLTLLFFDVYRPYSVTVAIWNLVKDNRYAADPATGSNHNRGLAVDVTLADLKTGKPLAMPTSFDDFTIRAYHAYNMLSRQVLANRALLKKVMEKAGFHSLATEWWHYSFQTVNSAYDLLDLQFYELQALSLNY